MVTIAFSRLADSLVVGYPSLTVILLEATRATGALETMSADVEQTIALLEKKSKAIDKDSSSSANQKMLRGLLEKL